MIKLEFDESQIALLNEIKAPYEPERDYIMDYSIDEDCPLSILVEYVQKSEVDYAQSSDVEVLKKAGEIARVVDILMAYEEYAFAVYALNQSKEAA